MELKFNATIDLKPADVERIITEVIQNQMQGFHVTKVRFEAGLKYEPMDRCTGTPAFTGVKVEVAPKPEATMPPTPKR